MQGNSNRRLRESGIPIDRSGPPNAFAVGIGPDNGEPLSLIPKEDWPREIAAAAAEETEFWRGRSVPVQLMVELPFWLMIPDCEISVSHDRATVPVSVRGQYVAVSYGPLFRDSNCNVIFVGPHEDLKDIATRSPVVEATPAPVLRFMKTVLIFRSEAMEDAVLAFQVGERVRPQESSKLRRINRAAQYLESLAYAHIPLANKLISAYRFASHDPFAFQISTWDVPVWFLQSGDKLVRICLLPYSDRDVYPILRHFERSEPTPFYATCSEAVQSQTDACVAPGSWEILDAQSLLYRGRLDDAVRSAVTAIEVALEAQITKMLKSKGWSEQQINARLKETWNDFDKRLTDYEMISGTRIPGPVLSCIPYINGLRLKSEVTRVRKLRHRIVHEGLRVDYHSRGPMLRAIETMTWLFNWLSWEEGKAQNTSRNYGFFEISRGLHIPRYPVDYRGSGVVVVPVEDVDRRIPTADELLRLQYFASIEGAECDVELFSLMSFNYLGIDSEDAAAPAVEGDRMHERYYITHCGKCAMVFCLECNGLVDASTIQSVASRLLERGPQQEGIPCALCIINHQKDRAIGLRETKTAIPDDVNRLADHSGITLITAPDLRFLVQGAIEHNWDTDQIKSQLFLPGRRGEVPPAYHRIGTCTHFFGRISVMEVEIQPHETVETGKILGIRLATRYHEERIESLQIASNTVTAATGPCKVGIKTTLCRADVRVGQAVFIRIS